MKPATEPRIAWKTTIDGTVCGFEYHDGSILGTRIDQTIFELLIEGANGEIHTVNLINVQEMNIRDFWRGNIILSIFHWDHKDVPLSSWKELYTGRGSEEPWLQKSIAANKNTHFFALISSYGADIFATCDEMIVTRRSSSASTSVGMADSP